MANAITGTGNLSANPTNYPGPNSLLTPAIQTLWSKEILFQSMPILRFEQFLVKKTELGVQPGLVINFMRYLNLGSATQLVEGVRMQTNAIAAQQFSITVAEQGYAIAVSELLLNASFDDVMASGTRLLGRNMAVYLDQSARNTLMTASSTIFGYNKILAYANATYPPTSASMTAISPYDRGTVAANAAGLTGNFGLTSTVTLDAVNVSAARGSDPPVHHRTVTANPTSQGECRGNRKGSVETKRAAALVAEVMVRTARDGKAAELSGNDSAAPSYLGELTDSETLATKNVPRLGETYVAFIHPHQSREIREDPSWIAVQKYASPGNFLLGEVGRLNDVVFIETTQVYNQTGPSGSGPLATLPANTTGYVSIILGDNAAGHAISLPVELRDGGILDFGREHALAWYAIWGMGLITDQSVVMACTN